MPDFIDTAAIISSVDLLQDMLYFLYMHLFLYERKL